MAFRAPRYSYVHAARDLGVASITLDGSSADADFPIDNLIDDRAGTLMKFTAPSLGENIEVDLGVGFDTGINRVIVPANHNLTGIRVWQDDNAGFATPSALAAASSETPGTIIDYEFTDSTQRYLRFVISGSSTLWQVPQLVFTKVVTLTTGVALADSVDEKRDNSTTLNQSNGLRPTIQHGPQQRYVEYEYESPLEGADLTAMEALVDSVGTFRPFYIDPASFSTPPETDEPVLAVKFDEMPDSKNTILVPMSGARSKAYRLKLIESLD